MFYQFDEICVQGDQFNELSMSKVTQNPSEDLWMRLEMPSSHAQKYLSEHPWELSKLHSSEHLQDAIRWSHLGSPGRSCEAQHLW